MYGRVARSPLETPVRLADSDRRRFVMITGRSGLRRIRDKDGFHSMVELGHDPESIERELSHGMRFFLVTFERPEQVYQASWAGVINAAVAQYPCVEAALRAALPDLRSKSLADFEAQAGFSFKQVHRGGIADERFLNLERFLATGQTSADVRLFLFNELHLNELFTGNGRTLTYAGATGVKEYVTPNVDIASLKGVSIRPLEVKVP